MRLVIEVVPADDPAFAAAARLLLAELAGGAVEEERREETDSRRAGDWIEIATLLLSVPGSLKALAEFANLVGRPGGRKAARDRIEPKLGSLRAGTGAGRQVTLTVGTVTLDLGRASVDEVLDALATAGIAAQGRKS